MDQDRRFHGGPEVSAVDGGDRLRVKLKLPLLSAVASDGGDGSSSPSPSPSQPLSDGRAFSHICQICNKGFSSGKALGGHMRMHYEANRLARLSSTTGNDADHKGSFDQKPECAICGREFSSMKALYGHMRSHPDRTWRGIQPPTPETAKRSSSSSLKIDDMKIDVHSSSAAPPASNGLPVVDCTRSLPCWSITARRGRKTAASAAASASASSVVSGPEEQTHEAVHDLVLLAKAENSAANSDDFNRKERKIDELCHAIDGDSDHVGSSKRKLQLKTDQEKNVFYDLKLSPDSQTSDDGSAEEEHLNSDGELGRKKVLKVKKIEEIGKLNFPDDETPEDHAAGHQIHLKNPIPKNKYRCNMCKKTFPSHQALGGHKSSHYKPKKTHAMVLQPSLELESATSEEGGCTKRATPPTKETDSPETETQEADGGSGRSGRYQVAQIFKMTIITCHHGVEGCKGCRSIGTTEAQTSQVTSLGESSTQTGRKMLNFDLNELPPTEEGEGDESCFPHPQQPNK